LTTSGGYQYASLWRRAGAMLIDVSLVAMVLSCELLAWIALTGEMPDWESRRATSLMAGTAGILFVLMIVLDSMLQGTPGLQLMDCRIVDARTGRRINLGQSLRRGMSIPLSVLPGLLGLFWIGWDRRRQTFHDKLAGTLVVRNDDALKALRELYRESL
jgi:uncharacterized RDD family membrane protein YckC